MVIPRERVWGPGKEKGSRETGRGRGRGRRLEGKCFSLGNDSYYLTIERERGSRTASFPLAWLAEIRGAEKVDDSKHLPDLVFANPPSRSGNGTDDRVKGWLPSPATRSRHYIAAQGSGLATQREEFPDGYSAVTHWIARAGKASFISAARRPSRTATCPAMTT